MTHREILERHGFDVRLDNEKGEFLATRGRVSFIALEENGTLELCLNGPSRAEENAMSVEESGEVLTAYMEAGSAHSELLRIGTDEEDNGEDEWEAASTVDEFEPELSDEDDGDIGDPLYS